MSGALEKSFESWLTGKQPDPWDVLEEAAISGVTAGVGSKITKAVFPKSVRGRFTKYFFRYFGSDRAIRQYLEGGH